MFGVLQRLCGADISIFPNVGGRFGFSAAQCRSIVEHCRDVAGIGKPIFPSPGGGMTVEKAPEMKQMYGGDVVYLLGGSLLRYRASIGDGIREMRHALELALQGYAGALVVISHDRHLLRNTVDQYFLVDGGAVAEFDGTLSDYYQRMLKTPGRADKSGEVAATTGQDKKALRRDSAQQRRQLAPLKKKVQQLELSLDRLQQQLVDLTGQLQAPELYDAGNKEQLQQLLRDQGALKKIGLPEPE